MGITGIILIGSMVSIIVVQNDKCTWTTRAVRVQFQEELGLQAYNGCYKIDDRGGGYDGRDAYKRENDEISKNSIPTFGYCQDERQWILFQDDEYTTPCNNSGRIILSSGANNYDISASYN